MRARNFFHARVRNTFFTGCVRVSKAGLILSTGGAVDSACYNKIFARTYVFLVSPTTSVP